jgi:hypothetical protein
MWLTDWMVDTARCVHTAGFGLLVAAAALRAMMPTAAIPAKAGASRHGDRAHLAERYRASAKFGVRGTTESSAVLSLRSKRGPSRR